MFYQLVYGCENELLLARFILFIFKLSSLEIWPGFKTSILQYEDQILLNLDISHKVLRTDSVLDTLYLIYNNCGKDFNRLKDLATKQLVGEIVMTR